MELKELKITNPAQSNIIPQIRTTLDSQKRTIRKIQTR